MEIRQLIDRFSGITALVVGDIMLDQYWWGTVQRISPEAPVPVVRLNQTTMAAGGAANVAANVVGLGATPILLGGVGDDDDSRNLFAHLKSLGISTDFIHTLDRPTSVKTRIVAHSQHVVRVDKENSHPLSEAEEARAVDAIEDLTKKANVVIISDYAKGFLTPKVIKNVIKAAVLKGIPILVDPKGRDYSKYNGATVLTPNRQEAAEACNISLDSDGVVEIAGKKLLDRLGLSAVVITEGENGMTLFEKGSPPVNLRARALEIFDVTGAGDTVVACLGVALASGIAFREAVNFANIAAGLVVEQVGTSAISTDRLLAKIESFETQNG